jgi:hypothetical protein
MVQRKLDSFLGERTTVLMMRLDSTLLMQLKVVTTNGKNATKAGSSLHYGKALVSEL